MSVQSKNSWTAVHNPGANVVASASKAAGAAGVRHVATAIYAKLQGGTAAPAAVQATVRLRDGASGAGTVLFETVLTIGGAIAATDEVFLEDLWIEGSPATAMTLEFAAAGGANTFEVVDLVGADA
jgi:hypothetical protein